MKHFSEGNSEDPDPHGPTIKHFQDPNSGVPDSTVLEVIHHTTINLKTLRKQAVCFDFQVKEENNSITLVPGEEFKEMFTESIKFGSVEEAYGFLLGIVHMSDFMRRVGIFTQT